MAAKWREKWDSELAMALAGRKPSDRAEYMRERHQRHKARFQAYRKTLSCKVCGDNRWYVLDFHHRNGRSDKTSYRSVIAIAQNCRWETVMKELALCDVLCANCHRERHYLEALDEADDVSE